jgi:hypothetical protein
VSADDDPRPLYYDIFPSHHFNDRGERKPKRKRERCAREREGLLLYYSHHNQNIKQQTKHARHVVHACVIVCVCTRLTSTGTKSSESTTALLC